MRKVQAAISVHSFGNVLIYPWGYKVTIEDDGGILMIMAVRNIKKCNTEKNALLLLQTLSTWNGNVE